MPIFPDLKPPLSGPGVRVRQVAERDIPEILIAHQDDPRLYLALGSERPPSGGELGRRVEGEAAERTAGVAAWLTVTREDSDDCCGQVHVHDVSAEHCRAELEIWIAAGHRGAGLGTGGLALVGRWLLEDCGILRVELLAEHDNQALAVAARRAGFAAEGVLRGYRRSPPTARRRPGRADILVLSLIAADLEPVHA